MLDKIKKFFKENYGTLIFIALTIIVFYIPTDYDIDCDGGLIDLKDRIEVSPSYEMDGSLNITYVGGRRGTIATLFLSWIIPSWDAYKVSDYLIDDETYAEQLARGKVSLREAEQNSLYVSLKEAGYDVNIKSYEITVIHIDSQADTSLEVGDVIKSVDGVEVKSVEDFDKHLKTKKVGDNLSLKVMRKNKEKEAYAKLRESEDGRLIVGMYINPIIELEYPEDIDITFNKNANEYGSSGGLMNTLLIYNKLTKEDITKGDVISGTGVINIDGTVDPIAGVKYKLRGAYKEGADVFIAPTENYEEALKVAKENKMDIEIIEAKNFKQVIEDLKNRKN